MCMPMCMSMGVVWCGWICDICVLCALQSIDTPSLFQTTDIQIDKGAPTDVFGFGLFSSFRKPAAAFKFIELG